MLRTLKSLKIGREKGWGSRCSSRVTSNSVQCLQIGIHAVRISLHAPYGVNDADGLVHYEIWKYC